jgi:hypothetical protein
MVSPHESGRQELLTCEQGSFAPHCSRPVGSGAIMGTRRATAMRCPCLHMEMAACQLAHPSIACSIKLPIYPHPPGGSLMKSLAGILVYTTPAPCGRPLLCTEDGHVTETGSGRRGPATGGRAMPAVWPFSFRCPGHPPMGSPVERGDTGPPAPLEPVVPSQHLRD